MNPVTTSIFEEILDAHSLALGALKKAGEEEPTIREGCKLLYRCIETWELEVLVSHIGSGIDVETLQRVQGALAAFRLMKDLLHSVGTSEALSPKKMEQRAQRFTEALLGHTSTPV